MKDENETNNKKSCSKEEDADLTTLLVMFIITSGKINFYCASSKIINYNSIFEGLSFRTIENKYLIKFVEKLCNLNSDFQMPKRKKKANMLKNGGRKTKFS